MELLANWGTPDLIGFTGIQFLGPHSIPISSEDCTIRYNTYNSPNIVSANSASLLRSNQKFIFIKKPTFLF